MNYSLFAGPGSVAERPVAGPPGAARAHFATLDGLRGVAAVAVVLLHLDKLFRLGLAPSGHLAVDVFFVLSGFVVAHAYEARLRVSSMSLRDFVVARVIRFYPLYLAGLVLGAGVALAELAASPETSIPGGGIAASAFLGLFFLPAPVDSDGNLFPLNLPAWSLFLELVVNIGYAASLRLLSTKVILGVLVVSGALLAVSVGAQGDAGFGVLASQVGPGLARATFSFFAGVLLYRSRLRLPRIDPIVVWAALALLLLAPVPHGWRAAYDLAFIFVASPVLVALGSRAEPGRWLMPVCRYLGAISFAIYAIHYPLLSLAHGLDLAVLHGAGPVLGGLVLAGLLVGCPLLVRFYDEPLRRWLSERQRRGGAAPIAVDSKT